MGDFLTNILSVILSPSTATRRQRRTLGTVILVVVVIVVLVGSLCMKAGVSPGTSLLFWGICLLLMLWSVFLAYLDVRCIRHEFRDQRKKLFLSIFSRPDLKKKQYRESDSPSASGEEMGQSEASTSSRQKRD